MSLLRVFLKGLDELGLTRLPRLAQLFFVELIPICFLLGVILTGDYLIGGWNGNLIGMSLLVIVTVFSFVCAFGVDD